jgi:hypothetical protein
MISRVLPTLLAAALFTTTLSVRAAEPDFTIELGKRVGAIQKSSTLAQIKEAYGAKNVKSANLPGPEGTTLKGAILFKGGDREMHVIWNDEKPEKEVFDVQLIGKAWVIGDKLKLGASIADVEAVNGGAFKVSGFDWDMGGFSDFKGGKLATKVMVRFYPAGQSDESLSGDKPISTTDKKLRAAKPTVTELFVVLR